MRKLQPVISSEKAVDCPLVKIEIPQEDGSVIEAMIPIYAQSDSELIISWLDGKSERTIRAYLSDIHMFYIFTKRSLLNIKTVDVQQFKNSLARFQPRSRTRIVAAVKSLISYAQEAGILPFNYGKVVKLKKPKNELAERIMSEQQVVRLFAVENEETRNHAILTTLYRGGLRASELCDLRWRDLSQIGQLGQLTVYGKGDKTRFVPLDVETWKEITALRTSEDGDNEYVFKSRQDASSVKNAKSKGERLDPSTVYRIVNNAAIEANIATYTAYDKEGKPYKASRVSPHWLRHAHASHAQQHGAPVTLVQKTLGHASIETTVGYTHIYQQESSAIYLKV